MSMRKTTARLSLAKLSTNFAVCGRRINLHLIDFLDCIILSSKLGSIEAQFWPRLSAKQRVEESVETICQKRWADLILRRNDDQSIMGLEKS